VIIHEEEPHAPRLSSEFCQVNTAIGKLPGVPE
jgi:hypothetical protein